MNFMSNMPVSDEIRKKAAQNLGKDNMLFAIVGDLKLSGEYGNSALVFGRDRVFVYDESDEDGYVVDYEETADAKVKRMYGNAIFRVKMKDGSRKDLIRFSYAPADLADAGAAFVKVCRDEGYSDANLEIIRSAYEKMRSFCPKCGRQLASPDSPCINCAGKGKMLSKFAKYVAPQKWNLLLCIVLSAVTTALSLAPTYITSILVDDVLPNRDMQKLAQILVTLSLIYIVQFSVTGLRQYRLRCASDGIITDLRKDVFAKAQYLPMRFYDKSSTGSVINRVNSDTATVKEFVMKISQEAIVQFFTLVGIIVIMFSINWRLALFALCPVPVVVLISRQFGKMVRPKYRRLWRRSSAIYSMLTDSIPGIRVIKAFSNENSVIDKFANHCEEWKKEDKRAGVNAAVFPTLITFFVTCGSLLIWGVGGKWTIDESYGVSAGILVSFISYTTTFYNPVNFFANLSDSYENAIASAEKIFDILDAEPEHDFGNYKSEEPICGKVEFKNVSFSFDRSVKTLNNVNLTVEPGDIVGIVGTTGAGKSTLINLLMRYYDDYEGEILIDGKNIRDIDMSYYRSQIGFVQQEPLMFRDSVFNNIAYGCGEVKTEEVLHAAQVANAHGFISKMPDAYDTVLGERGVGLSGGEKQRVSIARAVLKNPGLLIFDEATAAVDSETEYLIQGAIEHLIKGRTTFMIAHRLSTLRKANKIVVIDKGEIIECGPPEELLERKGKYYKLVQIQSMSEQLLKEKRSERFD
ncbi:MAG: ABC transporter ATP-binding protein/permease [Clostridiales bacterium]|nr:ABC transporter ATP-binding protein/permease [Clostridiales bacterium]